MDYSFRVPNSISETDLSLIEKTGNFNFIDLDDWILSIKEFKTPKQLLKIENWKTGNFNFIYLDDWILSIKEFKTPK